MPETPPPVAPPAGTSAGDALRETALRAWRAGDPPPAEVPLAVDRSFAGPGEIAEISVSYRIDGPPEAPITEARIPGATFVLEDPVRLEPVTIPKPWGREVWLTGMEARGESRVVAADGGTLGLASYLALAPRHIHAEAAVVLLKALEPRPQPVLGELYFEIHEEKREVYVVTHVDPESWPDGTGYIRYGMNQNLRAQYGDDEAFRAGFLDAVQAFEAVRRAADESGRLHEAAEEEAARIRVEAFSSLVPLRVGDVVSIANGVPHSLQHGVRVIEFQTPTYERLIISFPQKVLTQDRWDSAAAVARMSIEQPPPTTLEVVGDRAERVATFEDFGVWRVGLDPGTPFRAPPGLPYVLCFCLEGDLALAGACRQLSLGAGEAAFVPREAVRRPMTAAGGAPARCLLAAPGL